MVMPPSRITSNLPFSKVRTSPGCFESLEDHFGHGFPLVSIRSRVGPALLSLTVAPENLCRDVQPLASPARRVPPSERPSGRPRLAAGAVCSGGQQAPTLNFAVAERCGSRVLSRHQRSGRNNGATIHVTAACVDLLGAGGGKGISMLTDRLADGP